MLDEQVGGHCQPQAQPGDEFHPAVALIESRTAAFLSYQVGG